MSAKIDLQRGTLIDYFGAKLFVPKGHFDEPHMLAGGVPEPHVIQTFKSYVRPGDTVIDIGANIGTHTFALASLVGPHGKVFAVEADIDNAASLRHSILASGSTNIFLLHAAAADRPGMIRLLVSQGTNSVFSATAANNETKIAPMLPLDSVIRERVDFIKIDIEGAELLALRGLTNVLTYSRPIILTEFAPAYIANALGADRSHEFLSLFAEHGYDCHAVDPYGKLHEKSSIEAILEAHAHSLRDYQWNHVELLFIPSEARPRQVPEAAATQAADPAPPPALAPPAEPPPKPSAIADMFVLPPFLSVSPTLPDVPWVFTPPSFEYPVSQLCTSDQMDEPLYRTLASSLGLDPTIRHRKVWEYAFILSAIRASGMLTNGHRGLGFGTGQEALPSALAAAGLSVVATDAPEELPMTQAWSGTKEWTRSARGLWKPELISEQLFDEHVTFRAVDMNAIDDDLRGFDFCWSAGSLEHIGSIRHSTDFILKSLETLRPGGLAVHVTEQNLSSDTQTLDEAGLCLFRRRDIEQVVHELVQAGHSVAPLNFWPGNAPADTHVDVAPYGLPHLKLQVYDYITTSIGLIIHKSLEDA